MDERPDAYSDSYDTRIGRVKPVMSGRSIALPPLAPIVGVLGLVLGLVVGFGLAPAAAPAPTPGPTTIAVASPSSPAVPSVDPGYVGPGSTFELPPVDGLSLAQALEALNTVRMAPATPDVVSARIVRWTEVWSSPATPPDWWVWAITVRSASPFWCSGESASESPSPPAGQSASCADATTALFVFDYQTGEFLEAMSPAFP
jgi:hypothetical protein